MIRNQAKESFDERIGSGSKSNSSTFENQSNQEAVTQSVWGELSGLGGASQGSAFADLSSQDDDNADLLAMLEARDGAIAKNEDNEKVESGPASSSGWRRRPLLQLLPQRPSAT